MCSIRESREYQIGYGEGARDGWYKCYEGISAMIEAARNPPQILIQCSNSADALRLVWLGKSPNSAMVPCSNHVAGTCCGIGFTKDCSEKPCLILAQHPLREPLV